jgi:hypothetical protein
LPLACLGSLGALASQRGRVARYGLLAAAAAGTAFLLAGHGFAEIFSEPLGRYTTVRVQQWMQHGQMARREIPYYNLRPILVALIACLTVLLYAALALARPWLERGRRVFLAMGRRSLGVYILHLSVLAAFVVGGGKRPLQKTWEGDAVILGVIALCWAYALGRDAFAARKALRRKASSPEDLPERLPEERPGGLPEIHAEGGLPREPRGGMRP